MIAVQRGATWRGRVTHVIVISGVVCQGGAMIAGQRGAT